MPFARNLKTRVLLTLLLGFGTLILLMQEWQRMPDGHLHACVLDVGQGDSILLISPRGHTILIDGGPDFSALSGMGNHLPFFRRRIDLLVLTHPNLDHLVAIPEMIERYDIGAALLSGISFPLPQYNRMLTLLKEKRIPVIIADPAKDVVFDDGLLLDILWPTPSTFGIRPKNENDTSVALRAIVGNSAIVLTGDMEEAEERAILRTGQRLRASALKVAHHGSKTSTSTGWLLAVAPEQALISVGKGNSFGHPHRGIIDRLAIYGITTRRTDLEGEICWSSP